MTANSSGGPERRKGDRKTRLAAALRANLRRRKAPVRESREEAEETRAPERDPERR